MCGIVGFTGKRQAAPILSEGLKKLEYRGYDSAGIAVLQNGMLKTVKAAGRVSALEEKVGDLNEFFGNTGIGHTRWATHGAPSDTNSHPHTDGNGRIAVVHNGIIENYSELKSELAAEGAVFLSETDTEVVPHLISKYYKLCNDLIESVKLAVSRLKGAYSLGVICADCPEKLVAVKNKSPLIIGILNGENLIASDVTALIAHTDHVIYMEDGQIAVLEPDDVTLYSASGLKLEKTVTHIDWDVKTAELSGYDCFMMKEIAEQPRAIELTVMPRTVDGKVKFEGLKLGKERLEKINRIVITACGSASYAGKAAEYMFEKLLRIPVSVEIASELRYRAPVIDENTLAIVVSQSGETADTIAALSECKRAGAYVISIVNVVGSTIARMSDDVLYTWAGPEISVATTKGYTSQLSLLYLLGLYIAESLNRISKDDYERYIKEVQLLPSRVQAAIDINNNITALAEKYKNECSVFFIGRNMDYAVAMEGSLKLKEISYIHSEAYPAGELKHGTISLVEKGSLVIALACFEPLFEKMLANIKEVKARGATVVAVVNEGNTAVVDTVDDILFVPRVNPLFQAAAEVVPLQLLAYSIAKVKGNDIDKPRNLAKSVTVE